MAEQPRLDVRKRFRLKDEMAGNVTHITDGKCISYIILVGKLVKNQGWIYSCGGPGAIKMWRALISNNRYR
jgi:hypothetical protein